MLSAVLIAREMVASGARRRDFQVLDRIKPWDVRMRTGGRKVVELPLGNYDAVLLRLETKIPEGEPPREETKFKGLFGLKGSIEIWLEANSGVPVWITGTVPLGETLRNSIGLSRRTTSRRPTDTSALAIASRARMA